MQALKVKLTHHAWQRARSRLGDVIGSRADLRGAIGSALTAGLDSGCPPAWVVAESRGRGLEQPGKRWIVTAIEGRLTAALVDVDRERGTATVITVIANTPQLEAAANA